MHTCTYPISNAKADGYHHSLKSDKEATTRWRRNLGKIDGNNREQLTTADASHKTACNHHANLDGGTLEYRANDRWQKHQKRFHGMCFATRGENQLKIEARRIVYFRLSLSAR